MRQRHPRARGIAEQFAHGDRERLRPQCLHHRHLLLRVIHPYRLGGDLDDEVVAGPLADLGDGFAITGCIKAVAPVSSRTRKWIAAAQRRLPAAISPADMGNAGWSALVRRPPLMAAMTNTGGMKPPRLIAPSF